MRVDGHIGALDFDGKGKSAIQLQFFCMGKDGKNKAAILAFPLGPSRACNNSLVAGHHAIGHGAIHLTFRAREWRISCSS
jgi:hypothetical protein